MNNKVKAHLALIGGNLIYGLNYVVAKGIMPDYISPKGVIFWRVLIAFIFFNVYNLFWGKEKVDKKDLLRLAVCALFGVAINQIMFFEGLNLSTPINASILMTSTPIITTIFAFFLIKERPNLLKIVGIILGTSGATAIILMGGNFSLSSDLFVGNLFLFLNAVSFALYLVIAKPLLVKYKTMTVIRWVFNFGIIFALPFCIKPALEVNYQLFDFRVWASMFYILFAVTILAYLLVSSSLKHVSPIVTSSYIYTQPFIASVVSVFIMHEKLTLIEIISALLIFSGVYFVSRQKRKALS
ncbi:MAG: EamA/RhaT family transporter [Bacteroidetes bacterium HGW-Bacteroidetes-17]|nr:MAG: EamA/RhaT family transporter [Bacteroidetes bacterium HGW-Bacteroidetes-17]